MSDIVDRAEKEIMIFERIGKATSESLISEIRQQAEEIQRLRDMVQKIAGFMDPEESHQRLILHDVGVYFMELQSTKDTGEDHE